MNTKTLAMLLLLFGGAFAYLVVDFTPPSGVILLKDPLTSSTTYTRGCVDASCAPYPAGVNGLTRVDFSGVVEPYAAQIEVAGLSNCWITDCAKISPGNYENCETIPPNDPSFDQNGGNNVPWATITAGENAYTTHAKYYFTGVGNRWPPSWDVEFPQPNEGIRTIKAMCADFAGNLNATAIQDNILGDFVSPYATIAYSDGYQSSTTIPVTQAKGDWGIAPSGWASSLTQVATATIGDEDSLGAWSSWTTADTSGGNFNQGGADCTAYKFQHKATDAAARDSGFVASGSITKVEVNPPAAPVVSSSTHPSPTLAYASTDPAFSWTKPFACSGINGYVYVLNQNPTYVPVYGTDSYTAGTTAAYTGKAEGTWYFHVRARNKVGTGAWGTTAHFTINIDAGAPTPNPLTIASVTPDSSTQITVVASTASDAFPPINYQLNETTQGTTFDKTWQTSPTFVVTGLSTDVQYCFKAQVKDKWGNTGAWTATAVCAYTLANLPAAPAVTVDSGDSRLDGGLSNVKITISQNGNPSTVQYAIQDTTTGQYLMTDGKLGGAIAWATYAAWGGANGVVTTTLPDNSKYSFQVKAMNTASTSTAFGTATPITVLDRTGPSTPEVTATSGGTSVSLSWPRSNDETAVDANTAASWHFDEGTGITLGDASGNGNTCTLSGGATWTAGAIGRAVQYDGANGMANCGNGASLTLGHTGAIEFWAKIPSYPNSYWHILGKGASAGWDTNGYSVWYYYTSNILAGTITDKADPDVYNLVSFGQPTAGVWHHFAMTWDGSNMYAFVDGAQTATRSQTVDPATSAEMFYIAQEYGRFFNGAVDEVKVYNRALTLAEIQNRVMYSTHRSTALNVPFQPIGGLYDDFSTPANWLLPTGATVHDGLLTTANTNDNPALTNAPFDKNRRIDVDFRLTTGSRVHLVARAADANNFVRFWYDGGSTMWHFQTRIAGGFGPNYDSAPQALTLNQWYHATIIANNDNYKLYIDGRLAHEWTDASYSAGQYKAGLDTYQSAVDYDNFRITPLTTALAYSDTSATDAAAPPTPTGVGVTNPASYSDRLDIAWTPVLDAGTDWLHYVKAFDAQGNQEDSYATNGLVGYWKFSEGASGTAAAMTAKDSAGSNACTIYGSTTTWGAGKYGNALNVLGAGSYANCGNSATLDLNYNAGSVELWTKINVYPLNDPLQCGALVQKDKPGYSGWCWQAGTYQLNYWADNLKGLLTYGDFGNPNAKTVTVSFGKPSTGVWHHVIMTWDATNVKGFLDGALIGTSPNTLTQWETGGSLFINSENGFNNFDAAIDEVRVYNRALTDDEVTGNYRAGVVKRTTVTSGLKDYYVTGTGANAYSVTASYQATGLTPNTQYCYTVQARDNALNPSGTSAQGCKWTLAATPTLTANSPVSSPPYSCVITPDMGTANPTGTQYFIHPTTTLGGETNSTWTASTGRYTPTYTDTGLTAAHGTYKYQIKARNSQTPTPAETGYSTEVNCVIPNNAPTLPTLSSPTNTQTLATTTPTLDWSDSADADSDAITYAVQVATDASFTNKVIDTTVPTVSTFTPTAGLLLDEHTYYWRVKATDAYAGDSGWTAYWSFAIHINDPPTLPTLLLPPDSSEVTTDKPAFDWTDSSDPDTGDTITYGLQVDDNSDYSSPRVSKTGLTPSTYTPTTGEALADGTWHWHVMAEDNNGGQSGWTASWTVIVNTNQPPNVPTLATPADGSDVYLLPTLLWTAASPVDPNPGDTVTYELQVDDNSDYSSPLASKTALATTSYTLAPAETLTDGVTYYWHVQARDNKNLASGWTSSWSMVATTNKAPTVPTLLSPEDQAALDNTLPAFDWTESTDPDNNTLYYDLQIATDNQFTGGGQGTTGSYSDSFNNADYKDASTTANWDTAKGEIRLPAATGTTNVAFSNNGGYAIASSYETGHEASMAIDQTSTDWWSTGAPNLAWIRVYFNGEKTVDQVTLTDRAEPGIWFGNGQLEFSDGTVVGFTGLPDNGDPKIIPFAPVKAIYVTVRAVTGASGTGVGLREINVRQGEFSTSAVAVSKTVDTLSSDIVRATLTPDHDELVNEGADLASGATVEASSQLAGYEAAKAADSSFYTEWRSAGNAADAWIQLSFSAAQTVNAVVLYDNEAAGTWFGNGRIQFSDMSEVPFTGLPDDGGKLVVRFPQKTTSYVKVLAGTNAVGYNAGLRQVSAYNAQSQTGSIAYQMSVDGGATWEGVTAGTEHFFTAVGSNLRWKATLTTVDAKRTPTIYSVSISYASAAVGGSLKIDKADIDASEYQLAENEELDADTTYYWHARATDLSKDSAWTDPWSFYVGAVSAANSIVVWYTDGSSQEFTLRSPNWLEGTGNTQSTFSGKCGTNTYEDVYVYYDSVALNSAKIVDYVVFNDAKGGAMPIIVAVTVEQP
jgi:hypothetical protein